MCATLVSPGVDVEIIDESNYGSSGPGTIPLIFIATASNKTNPSGSLATYTTPSLAGQLYLATSQRDLVTSFGAPNFKVVQGTPVHGYETNEYGLMAAYSYLGIANQCYILRADLDLAQLEPSVDAPVGPPIDGTYWLDLADTVWGVFQSNGNPSPGLAWLTQPVNVAMTANVNSSGGVYVPKSTYGNDGDFAVVPLTADNPIFEKINGNWLRIGSTAWMAARPTTVMGTPSPASVNVGDSITINGSSPIVFAGTGALTDVLAAIQAANVMNIHAEIDNMALVIKNVTGGNLTISNSTGTPLTVLGITPKTYSGVGVFYTNDASYPANSVPGDIWIKGSAANKGAAWDLKVYNASTGLWTTVATPFYAFNSLLSDGDPNKDLAVSTAMGIPAVGTCYVGYDVNTGSLELRRFGGSNWSGLTYEADTTAPSTPPADGTLWYDVNYQVDIMVGNGENWISYRRQYPGTDPNGVIIDGSQPTTQLAGTPLVTNDIWLNSSDLENYPALYRYDASTFRWSKIDLTDNTTPFGIIFEDARADSGVAFQGQHNPGGYAYNSTSSLDMTLSDYVDPDAPDARNYPAGMLLFNTRYSNNNVKVWRPNYFNAGGYDPTADFTLQTYNVGSPSYIFPALSSAGRWVTDSGNKENGSPYMGRKAQRAMIVREIAAQIAANQDIRSEFVYFNLVSAPGYTELLSDLVTLNTDNKEVAFIVGDTPIRLTSNGTAIQNWATNANNAATDGEDGLVTANDYVGIYYPWGLSTDLSGFDCMIPPSAIALRTIAYNDQVAYPWFAPAGYNRGLVTNAATVGYLSSSGTYVPTILNNGQRDVLYSNKINPISFFPGRGLVVFGQKTLNPATTALDRINVARLVNYLKYNLDHIARSFLFEMNDQQTRDSVTITFQRFLNGIVGLRGLYDYAVLCDTTNNTPQRIDNNELWVDIAIKPERSIEFIFIPVRIVNTGTSLTS